MLFRSYSRYKVGVSGFYKQPLFSVLDSDDEKPVMTDELTQIEQNLNLTYYVTDSMYNAFKELLEIGQMTFT